MRICSEIANIHASPSIESETTSQALLGEYVKVSTVENHWSHIELLTDGYCGFVENHHLVDDTTISTHKVIIKFTPLFDEPDIKSPVKQHAPLASELSLHECDNHQFLRTHQQCYVWKQHVWEINGKREGQLVDTAQSLFLGSPYLWGGRSPVGLDCSALVQLTALLHGWQLPRDTADQVTLFHNGICSTCSGQLKRQPSQADRIEYGQQQTDDLVYWPGHVAMVLDPQTIVHATAHSLLCCNEPLHQVEARAGKPESIWRLMR